MTQSPLLEVERVSKRFGAKIALRDVSVQVGPGECLTLLGANGAGKTTLLRTMATLARPTRGTVRAFGVDAWAERKQVRARLGVVAHQPYVYPELTCRENLRFFASMYAIDRIDARVDEMLGRVGLAARANDQAGTLSRGLLQRLNLARAILHDPGILILDEPDTGLDLDGRDVLSSIIDSRVRSGGSVVLTTHAIEYALDRATRVFALSGGQAVLDSDRGAIDLDEVRDAIGAGALATGR